MPSAKDIAPAFKECFKQFGRPAVRTTGTVDFIRIVEKSTQTVEVRGFQRAVEPAEIIPQRGSRKMIDDVPFAARSRTLDHLPVRAGKYCIQVPGTGRRCPVEARIGIQPVSYVERLAIFAICHDDYRFEHSVELDLVERKGLK